jgi:hypothetical protein
LTASNQRETSGDVRNIDLERAIALVRAHQTNRFVELMRGLTIDEHARTIDAINILREHGDRPCRLEFSCETAVMLAQLLSEIGPSNRPDLEKARCNFVVAVCQSVERVSPVLVAVALGELKTRNITCPKKTSSSTP